MKISKYFLPLILFLLLLGLSLWLTEKSFVFGDGSNFKSYAQLYTCNLIELNQHIGNSSIASWSVLNTYGVSCIYSNKWLGIAFNVAILLFLSSPFFWNLFKKGEATPLSNISINISALYLSSPLVLMRFYEPSREYMLCYGIFISSWAFFSGKSSQKTFLLLSIGLLMSSIARPVYLPVIILVFAISSLILGKRVCPEDSLSGLIIKVFTLRAMNVGSIIITFLGLGFSVAILFLFASSSIELTSLYDKSGEYSGVMSDFDRNSYFWLPLQACLNVFGGVKYLITANLFDFVYAISEMIWRFLVLFFIVRYLRFRGIVCIAFYAIIVSLLYPFPHPRYLLPLFFVLSSPISLMSMREEVVAKLKS